MRRPLPAILVALFALVAVACASNGVGFADGDSAAGPASPTSTTAAPSADQVDGDDAADVADETVAGDSGDAAGPEAAGAESADSESATETTTTTEAPAEPPADACTAERTADIGLQTGAIESGGLEYRYQWTVPSSYDGTPVPVVLDFHGLGSSGAQQAVFSGFAALAETEDFLAVHPTGVATSGDDRNSWELPQFDSPERDDVAFVEDLLDHVAAEICIDQTRIYSAGMSNGGFFTSQLVCTLGHRIAAAVSVAGVTHDDSCRPSRPVPYLAFHGTDDDVVPYAGGGVSTLTGDSVIDFFEQVMPDEFAEFAADSGCTESVDSPVAEQVTLRTWTGCDADVELGFYTLEDGGHTWPGSPVSNGIAVLGVTNMEVDATAVAWEFFERHQLPSAD